MFQFRNLQIAYLNIRLQLPIDWNLTDSSFIEEFQIHFAESDIEIKFGDTEFIPEISSKPIYRDNKQFIFRVQNVMYYYYGKYDVIDCFDKIRDKTAYFRRDGSLKDTQYLTEVLCKSNGKKTRTVRSLLVWGGLPHILADFRRVILHSSFLAYREKAILFTAPSGTGKSTQAELWRVHRPGAEVINGDRSILSCDGGRPFAHGIPLCGTSGITKNRSLPVRAIVVLRQGPENRIRRLGGREAFSLLFSECSVSLWSREDTETVTDLLNGIISSVPVYLYACRPDASAVDDLEAALDSAQ